MSNKDKAERACYICDRLTAYTNKKGVPVCSRCVCQYFPDTDAEDQRDALDLEEDWEIEDTEPYGFILIDKDKQ